MAKTSGDCNRPCPRRYSLRKTECEGADQWDGRRIVVWRQFSVRRKRKGRRTGLFILLCIVVFIASFVGSAAVKLTYRSPEMRKYTVAWNDDRGEIYTDLSYGTQDTQTFDLYVPADSTKETYGLVVYLHAGGFTTGDKADDREMLQWLCSKGFVAAGINYTLFDEAHPQASVYSQSKEIQSSIPAVVEEASKRGYPIDRMAIAGGSAGGCLALLYAYRDAQSAPVPVKMVFEAVGPASFYAKDWSPYGLDTNKEAAAGLFSVMAGKEISPQMIGTPAYEEAIKEISAYRWVNEHSVPTVCAYGVYDKICPFNSSKHLIKALEENGVTYTYIEFPHSGHALQNDDACYLQYMQAIEEYLDLYMRESNEES